MGEDESEYTYASEEDYPCPNCGDSESVTQRVKFGNRLTIVCSEHGATLIHWSELNEEA